MTEIQHVDILIVGSGPSGTSTALHLVKSNPAWAKRIVVVDKAVHPREKLCGGGVTHIGQNILARLGLPFEPKNFEVREVRLIYGDQSYSFFGNPVFRIVRRDEFDHWLVKTAESLNITVRQGEAVTDVVPHDDYVEVTTEKAIFHAKTVVAADGSRSFVRSRLKWDDDSRVARLIEVLTPENAHAQPEFRDGVAVFDFTPMTDHQLQGYYWDFPSYVNGQPFMNRGVFDSRARPERAKADLKQTLGEAKSWRNHWAERRRQDFHAQLHQRLLSAATRSHPLWQSGPHQNPHPQIASLGIARTFQNIALYTGLSTLDNLMAARHIHMKQSSLASMLYWGRAQREEVQHRARVEEIIDFLEIAHIRKAIVGALSYGLRKRVELGRALAMEAQICCCWTSRWPA
jgi:2-polyprenyl-6-methoxyphenol hydroxylase-like FAD-dependent oxidoreductase